SEGPYARGERFLLTFLGACKKVSRRKGETLSCRYRSNGYVLSQPRPWSAQRPPSPKEPRSSQTLADHLKHITGQLPRTPNPLQLPFHQSLTSIVILAPASQRRQLTRSNLRIEAVQLNHQ